MQTRLPDSLALQTSRTFRMLLVHGVFPMQAQGRNGVLWLFCQVGGCSLGEDSVTRAD